jgi:hypothetical protein
MTLLSRLLDERFFAHRRRSTSIAGMASMVAAWGMFMYRLLWKGSVSWDLLAVLLTFVVVKLSLMTWFYLTD